MNDILFAEASLLFTSVLVLVLLKPRNIGIGYWAVAGGVISVVLGLTTLPDLIIVWNIVWNATFTFVSVIVITLVFDEAGLFEYIAIRIARYSAGSSMHLFLLVMLLTAAVSALFANDGAALVLTPIVIAMAGKIGLDRKGTLAFVMAVGFVSDTGSIPLVVSNLVNIVSASYFHITFINYAIAMLVPDVVSVTASILLIMFFYRRNIQPLYNHADLPDPSLSVRDPVVFCLSIPIIILLVIAYSAGGFFNVPVAAVAVPFAAAVLLIAKRGKRIDTRKILREAPWQIVLFSFGMYVVVFGLGRAGLTQLVSSAVSATLVFGGPVPMIFSGFLFSFMAAVMNNMPSVMIGNLALVHVTGGRSLVYANVIGNDIGPKFTPIGSLATMLWLYTLDRKNSIRIRPLYYVRVGLTIAVPVLFVTLLSAYLMTLI
ncbi:MAG: arsenical efflux pump membrane protein ArsB [Thermoplasmata archaeon]|nr:arsenical efflux pump membrane protein ArsB [Candidatus Sysuiplasma acidicola]MBX8645299.1 arsenical efflux pump membrane protein ArsB [Candidatus Sysuiplasma acidicola]